MADGKPGTNSSGHYNVIDWRSWKLARVCRSTLAAESQAASEAADALLFVNTFWNLLWRPWLPLDNLQTAKATIRPKLVIDAKALYDLLDRPQIQANSNTDKRTMIEALVTQDKIKCCNGKTLWVSSENQWADGLTKQSAAQLLADRLRTHEVSLKSDTSFQAAKKKTPLERKRNMEMFAAPRPTRALSTTFLATMMTTMVNAETPDNIHLTYHYHPYDYNQIYVTALTVMLTMFALLFGVLLLHRGGRAHHEIPLSAEGDRSARSSTPAMIDSTTQTEDNYESLESLRQRTDALCTEHTAELTALHHQLREKEFELYRRTQSPVFFTRSGRCWHADPECPVRYGSTEANVQSREYCTRCAHHLGSSNTSDHEDVSP